MTNTIRKNFYDAYRSVPSHQPGGDASVRVGVKSDGNSVKQCAGADDYGGSVWFRRRICFVTDVQMDGFTFSRREVIERPRNETEYWLLETVRRQSQQVGIAMPQVAIYQAPDINAFATGARRDASLVAVSTGLLQNMSRDEAEAVIAHEISHVANGDMVTMTLIQGVVNTFVIFISRLIAQIAAGFLSGDRDGESNSPGNPMVYFAVSMVLELVFGILASIITMWFSRHREFHADAGSAKLVGREKMIAALQRLKTSYEPQEAGSMMAFCINGKSKTFSELFMSHPPLDKRIEALRSGQYLK